MKNRILAISLVLLLAMGSLVAIGCPVPVVDPVARLAIAMGVEPPTLDLTRMTCGPSATVIRLIAPPLVDQAKDGTIIPGLAKSWEFSPDALTLTLNLRQGVKFHDGTPFNAEAVRFNLERFLQPGVPFRFMIAKVDVVEVVDEFTVKLHLTEPFVPMMAHLSHEFIGMFSPTAVKALEPGEIVTEPVGTGPFKFTEWVHGERIVMVANEDYWGGRPRLDEIVFKVVPEIGARVAMLEAGDVQMAKIIPPHDGPRLEADPAITLLIEPLGPRMMYIGINNQLAPFDDIRVRKAINYAIDGDALVNYVLMGVGAVATAPIASGVWGYHTLGPWPYNPERARELLAEAGFPDGFDTIFLHPTGRYVMDVAISEAIHAMLWAVGIRAEMVTKEWAAYLAFIMRPYEEVVHGPDPVTIFLLGWGCITGDADYGLFPLFRSDMWRPYGFNLQLFACPEVDRLLAAARVEMDPEKRKALYAEVQKLIWYQAPWGFLYVEGMISAVQANVHGVFLHPIGEIPRFEWAWIDH